MQRITTIGAACALVGLLAGPALADCVQEIVLVKQMADKSSDPAKREMAIEHLGMAQAKIVHVIGSPMQDEAMKDEMMSDDKGTAMKDDAMSEDEDMAMKDEAMKDEAMKDEMMSEDQGMAMMEDECMTEVMMAREALQ
jgi:hypothetical protein